jgi:hypothetical protein
MLELDDDDEVNSPLSRLGGIGHHAGSIFWFRHHGDHQNLGLADSQACRKDVTTTKNRVLSRSRIDEDYIALRYRYLEPSG